MGIYELRHVLPHGHWQVQACPALGALTSLGLPCPVGPPVLPQGHWSIYQSKSVLLCGHRPVYALPAQLVSASPGMPYCPLGIDESRPVLPHGYWHSELSGPMVFAKPGMSCSGIDIQCPVEYGRHSIFSYLLKGNITPLLYQLQLWALELVYHNLHNFYDSLKF